MDSPRIRATALTASLLLAGCAPTPPPCEILAGSQDGIFENGACAIADNDRVLVVERRFHGDIGYPGGRDNSGETAQCTAHRETWEETGLAVVVGDLLLRTPGTAIYRCSVKDALAVPAGPWWRLLEIAAVHWIPASELGLWEWRYVQQRELARQLLSSDQEP